MRPGELGELETVMPLFERANENNEAYPGQLVQSIEACEFQMELTYP